MTHHNDLERRLADHFASEAPTRAPDRVLLEALSLIDSTRQRHVFIHVPRRFQTMSRFARVAAAAVIVVALGAIGLVVLRSGPISGAGGTATPASQPGASAGPSAGLSGLPALTKDFTSAVNGFSIRYPGEWKATSATTTWPTGMMTSDSDHPYTDAFNGSNQAIYVISQKLAAATDPAAWIKEYQQGQELNYSRLPACTVVKTEPIVVDGVTGVMDTTCPTDIFDVVLITGGRAYDISFQGQPPDKAWALDVLKTLKLHPETAVDSSPVPSVSP
jgi:hypothetical protein